MTEVQSDFLIELRELMNRYDVEIHEYEEGRYEFITRDTDQDDQNYICIDIDDV